MLLVNTGKAVVASGGGGFLLDSITPQPSLAFSTRRLRAAYAGNCMKVKDNLATVFQEIGFVSDDVDQSAVDTFYTGVGAGVARVDIWHDQSANGFDLGSGGPIMRHSGANSGVQATVNGHSALYYGPALGGNGLTSSSKFLSDVITASAFTVIVNGYAVALAAEPAEPCGLFGDGANGYLTTAQIRNSSGSEYYNDVYDGTGDKPQTHGLSVSVPFVGITQLTGGFLKSWINGGTSSTPTATGNIAVMNSAHIKSTGDQSDVYVLELLVYSTALSAADLNTLANGSGITMGSLATRSGVTWSTLS